MKRFIQTFTQILMIILSAQLIYQSTAPTAESTKYNRFDPVPW